MRRREIGANRPSGVIERLCNTEFENPCCSGEPRGGEGTACPGRTLGKPCDLHAQCESGNRNVNLVCA